MKIWCLILRNIVEIKYFGPLFFLRHFAHAIGLTKIALHTWNIGIITLRPGNSDAAAFHQVFIDKTYDLGKFDQNSRVTSFYNNIISQGYKPLIIDAGANVGAASLWFSKKFPEALIIAIEPDPRSAKICRSNISHKSNIHFEEAAIGCESGNVDLKCTDRGWETQSVRTSDGSVAICTVNSVITKNKDKTILFLVKIDIEGFESDLFSKNTEWLNQAYVIMIETHDWLFPGKYTSRSFLKSLASVEHEILISDDTLVLVK